MEYYAIIISISVVLCSYRESKFLSLSVIFKEKPKLLNENIKLDDYDTVIIGTPIWASSYTPPLNTFLTENKMQNKTVYLFATHMGGGVEKCFAKMSERLEGNNVAGSIDFASPLKKDRLQVTEQVERFCESIKLK